MLAMSAALAVLLIGSLILSLVFEGVAGNESFSLPFANIFLGVLVGGIGFWFFGWLAVFAVLGLYSAWAVFGGLMDRFG